MKAIIPTLAIAFFTLFATDRASVLPSVTKAADNINTSNGDLIINNSGFEFTVWKSNINNEYSEFASGIFRGKLIVVSSKKIGGLGTGIDPNTNEPYAELFCMDIDVNGEISNPLLFSRILNTKHNEGQVSFSPDEHRIYYSRSLRANSENYQLYTAYLEKNSHGNWLDEKKITLNQNYSIENPHVSPDGSTLYFSSNKPGGQGGYDLYKATIQKGGSISVPINLGPVINSSGDEKFPHIDVSGTVLYFSSNGHPGLGGYDLFKSRVLEARYELPRNLGDDINSRYDELALTFTSENQGLFSSNKTGGQGGHDLYNFIAVPIEHTLQGIIVDSGTNQPLPNSQVVLYDIHGNQISSQTTGIDAHFSFSVRAFENYKLKILKSGFEANEFVFQSSESNNAIYKQVLKLSAKNGVVKK